MLRLYLPLLFAVLAACAPGQPGGSLAGVPDSGLSGVYSAQQVISDHPHHVILGHVIIANDGAATTRALVLSHQWDGVHFLRMTGAYADGGALPFRRLPRNDGCTRATCRNGPVGMIRLSRAQVQDAARSGFSARLHTNAGPIDITVPAEMFAEALDRVAGA